MNLFLNIEGVRKVTFHTNKVRHENKFIRRLKNTDWNSNYLSQLCVKYDKIIIIHCCKAFGLENLPKKILDKFILFPMYLTSSYVRSNEIVPIEYTDYEHKILSKNIKIITPSEAEKKDIIIDYGVAEQNISVIPRAINLHINSKVRKLSISNNIIYIGSIKKQKNNHKAIELIYELKKKNINSHLYLVGGVQDDEVFSHCKKLTSQLGLINNVTFCGVLSQKEIAELLNNMDINISVSSWETFGRGIFEGLCAGLPTLVFDNIDCLTEYTEKDNGIFYVKDVKDMTEQVYNLCTDSGLYQEQSIKAVKNKERFTVNKQKQMLIEEILQK